MSTRVDARYADGRVCLIVESDEHGGFVVPLTLQAAAQLAWRITNAIEQTNTS